MNAILDRMTYTENKLDKLNELLVSLIDSLKVELDIEHKYYQTAIEFFEKFSKAYNIADTRRGFGESRIVCAEINTCNIDTILCPYCANNTAKDSFQRKESLKGLDFNQILEMAKEAAKKKVTRPIL
jgi:hypothetical protein